MAFPSAQNSIATVCVRMRYTVTHDGLVIAGSETGLVDLDESRIAERTALAPAK